MGFTDRLEAGRRLGTRLAEWASGQELPRPLVLALPRGGVPVAVEVARSLGAPLDVLIVRKIGVPGRPETGVGAVVGDDPPLYDPRALAALGLDEERLAPEAARERAELRRRALLYRGDRATPEVAGRAVILVDDGLATGATARAALRHLRGREPARLVLAVPVGAPEAAAALRAEADEVVCLEQPPAFGAVSLWYEEFPQVDDEEVAEALNACRPPAPDA
ncbi:MULTISPECIES: phosphoribosyltransferase [Streptomyces]|uniref:Phosphoribosyltransferase n=1 Tax=Streptomyces rutgersensis TaxID=53451 RepID=A0ABX6RVC8_9ACTN|nr:MULTISPECIES: phosphoribosyltransferase family protein [Streptomyces]MDQ0292621.1 putative phosphoribosyltransferase [Streptomyces sp. DSM 41037]PJM83857.1 phosphoribosyltransferase [Streptomyces sp. TSRI0384-2]QNE83954.1 phosphoribosyltransferase [Streptomyces rutgersensis]WSU34936.1 phosphoribosyltransferase family protein [Streptomyces gougerotii]